MTTLRPNYVSGFSQEFQSGIYLTLLKCTQWCHFIYQFLINKLINKVSLFIRNCSSVCMWNWLILTDSFSSCGPAEWSGDWGDPVRLLRLPRSCVRSCISGYPALPPPAAREQLCPWSPGEKLWVRPRWRFPVFFNSWFFSITFSVPKERKFTLERCMYYIFNQYGFQKM